MTLIKTPTEPFSVRLYKDYGTLSEEHFFTTKGKAQLFADNQRARRRWKRIQIRRRKGHEHGKPFEWEFDRFQHAWVPTKLYDARVIGIKPPPAREGERCLFNQDPAP